MNEGAEAQRKRHRSRHAHTPVPTSPRGRRTGKEEARQVKTGRIESKRRKEDAATLKRKNNNESKSGVCRGHACAAIARRYKGRKMGGGGRGEGGPARVCILRVGVSVVVRRTQGRDTHTHTHTTTYSLRGGATGRTPSRGEREQRRLPTSRDAIGKRIDRKTTKARMRHPSPEL